MAATEPQPQVRTGLKIDVELVSDAGEVETLSFVIVREEAADIDEGFLAATTPLARAILGKFEGSQVAYRQGDIMAVRIVQVGSAPEAIPEDAAARRQETVKKAVQEAERTTQQIFATSVSSKWGDYDPDALEEERRKNKE
jgi:hypothetical protein